MNEKALNLKMDALKFGMSQTTALLEAIGANPSEWKNSDMLTLCVNLKAAFMLAENIFKSLSDENRDK